MSRGPCALTSARPSMKRAMTSWGSGFPKRSESSRRLAGGVLKLGTSGPSPAPLGPWHDAQYCVNSALPCVTSSAVARPPIQISDSMPSATLRLFMKCITTVSSACLPSNRPESSPATRSRSRARRTPSALPIARWLRLLLFLDPDFHLSGSAILGQHYGEFQHAVLVGRVQIIGFHAPGQLNGPLEYSVPGLAPIVLRMPGLVVFFARAFDGQKSSNHPDVDALRIDARKVDANGELIAFHERFQCRTESWRSPILPPVVIESGMLEQIVHLVSESVEFSRRMPFFR